MIIKGCVFIFLFFSNFNYDLSQKLPKENKKCTDQVVGSNDVAVSDNIGVLSGTPG